MTRLLLIVGIALLAACGKTDTPAPADTAQVEPLAADNESVVAKKKSGIALDHIDQATRPQDDFFQYANGAWLDKTEIPPDEVRYGSWTEVRERNEARL
jgi:hypothetical protein